MKAAQPTMTPEQEAEWERKLKDGGLFKEQNAMRHGTLTAYQYCHCPECRVAYRDYRRKYNARRREAANG